MSTNYFIEACSTYRLLREKGYSEKSTLKIVGDRHRLSRVQRNCLFRGVIARPVAGNRRARIVSRADVGGKALGLDWYNVLITVESYLRGRVLFLSDDGIVRDASATHGTYRTTALTTRVAGNIVQEIGLLKPCRVDAYLDMPIAFSGLMAEHLRELLSALRVPSDVTLVPSADYPLKSYQGVVASSDSAVLDGCGCACDLASLVLARQFGFTPPAVADLFPGSPGSPPR
jgi:hypothetical protein